MENHTTLLATEKIPKLLLMYSIPSIIGLFVNALYNMVDRIFVGRLVDSPFAIGSISIIFPFVMASTSTALLFGVGGAVKIGILLGEKKIEEAKKIFGTAVATSFTPLFLIAVLPYIFSEQILELLGCTKEILPFAKDYMKYIAIGSLFGGVTLVLNIIMRSTGYPKKAMYTLIIGAVLNIILDPIFISVFGMGVSGAALATLISQVVSFVWVLSHFLFAKEHMFSFNRKYLKFRWHSMIQLFLYGSPAFISQISGTVMILAINLVLSAYGSLYISSITIVSSVYFLFSMIVLGIAQGLQPIVSYNYGAKKYSRIKEVLYISIFYSTIISIIEFILIFFFPHIFSSIFTEDKTLLGITDRGLKLSFLMSFTAGVQMIVPYYFQCIGKYAKSTVLNLLPNVIFFIPSLVILPKFFGVDGIWYSFPVSNGLSFLIIIIAYILENQRLNKLKQD